MYSGTLQVRFDYRILAAVQSLCVLIFNWPGSFQNYSVSECLTEKCLGHVEDASPSTVLNSVSKGRLLFLSLFPFTAGCRIIPGQAESSIKNIAQSNYFCGIMDFYLPRFVPVFQSLLLYIIYSLVTPP